jgi:hypothetical protein
MVLSLFKNTCISLKISKLVADTAIANIITVYCLYGYIITESADIILLIIKIAILLFLLIALELIRLASTKTKMNYYYCYCYYYHHYYYYCCCCCCNFIVPEREDSFLPYTFIAGIPRQQFLGVLRTGLSPVITACQIQAIPGVCDILQTPAPLQTFLITLKDMSINNILAKFCFNIYTQCTHCCCCCCCFCVCNEFLLRYIIFRQAHTPQQKSRE